MAYIQNTQAEVVSGTDFRHVPTCQFDGVTMFPNRWNTLSLVAHVIYSPSSELGPRNSPTITSWSGRSQKPKPKPWPSSFRSRVYPKPEVWLAFSGAFEQLDSRQSALRRLLWQHSSLNRPFSKFMRFQFDSRVEAVDLVGRAFVLRRKSRAWYRESHAMIAI